MAFSFAIYTCTLRVKKTCLKSRVLLRRFVASITRIHCTRTRTTVEDHGCTGKGRHATGTTTQRFSIPMPLLLLYRTPSFGCSSFFVHRGLCKNHSIDVCGRTQCYTWTAATVLFVQVRTDFFDAYCTCNDSTIANNNYMYLWSTLRRSTYIHVRTYTVHTWIRV